MTICLAAAGILAAASIAYVAFGDWRSAALCFGGMIANLAGWNRMRIVRPESEDFPKVG